MGLYKYPNPVTGQYEGIKSKSIVNMDGTNEYTPDDVKGMDDKIDILKGSGTAKEKANKEDFDSHLADNIHIPKGLISMWSGLISAIPNGWALCDGQNGTPDLRDRFIVGAGNEYNVGDTGGEASHTLTIDEMPSHKHNGSTSSDTHSHSGSISTGGSHSHEYSYSHLSIGVIKGDEAYASGGSKYRSTGLGGSHSHTFTTNSDTHSHTVTINSTGGGLAHENRPPYYALCFIIKL